MQKQPSGPSNISSVQFGPYTNPPRSARQFVVEVDASDTGVGVVLSQCGPEDGKLHPCTFFSCRLSWAESNYDVGNRELLAVKIGLEECRHWLEGANQPFGVDGPQKPGIYSDSS